VREGSPKRVAGLHHVELHTVSLLMPRRDPY
jgi:hypothetical protein